MNLFPENFFWKEMVAWIARARPSYHSTKVVLIDKVVLGSPKKGDGNWQYFWVQVLCRQHLWVQKFEEKSGKFKIQIYNFAGLWDTVPAIEDSFTQLNKQNKKVFDAQHHISKYKDSRTKSIFAFQTFPLFPPIFCTHKFCPHNMCTQKYGKIPSLFFCPH